MKALAVLAWVGTIIGSAIGGFILLTGMTTAQSAPQEAVVCALAIAFAVIPYCVARALTEICRMDFYDKLENNKPTESDSKSAGYNFESIVPK